MNILQILNNEQIKKASEDVFKVLNQLRIFMDVSLVALKEIDKACDLILNKLAGDSNENKNIGL